MKTLILGSSSPRRYELLKATGLSFEVARPDIDETPHPDEAADVYVQRLSHEKALAIHTTDDVLILTADTTVADGKQILGKPEHPSDAASMLRQLRNRSHYVHSGVTLRDTGTQQIVTMLATTEVVMRDYSDQEIDDYIASGDPFGKAGSYAIQNVIFHPVERIQGCYTNVVGLPLCTVYALLDQFGIASKKLALSVTCSATNLPCLFNASKINVISGSGKRL